MTDRTLTASGPKQVITGKIKAGQKVNVSAKVSMMKGQTLGLLIFAFRIIKMEMYGMELKLRPQPK